MNIMMSLVIRTEDKENIRLAALHFLSDLARNYDIYLDLGMPHEYPILLTTFLNLLSGILEYDDVETPSEYNNNINLEIDDIAGINEFLEFFLEKIQEQVHTDQEFFSIFAQFVLLVFKSYMELLKKLAEYIEDRGGIDD